MIKVKIEIRVWYACLIKKIMYEDSAYVTNTIEE